MAKGSLDVGGSFWRDSVIHFSVQGGGGIAERKNVRRRPNHLPPPRGRWREMGWGDGVRWLSWWVKGEGKGAEGRVWMTKGGRIDRKTWNRPHE